MTKARARHSTKAPEDLTLPAVTTVRRMRDVTLRAFQPIPFPQVEPGFTFNANFCRNPMCPNFGPAPDEAAYADRYTLRSASAGGVGSRYKCNVCGMESRLVHRAQAVAGRGSVPGRTGTNGIHGAGDVRGCIA